MKLIRKSLENINNFLLKKRVVGFTSLFFSFVKHVMLHAMDWSNSRMVLVLWSFSSSCFFFLFSVFKRLFYFFCLDFFNKEDCMELNFWNSREFFLPSKYLSCKSREVILLLHSSSICWSKNSIEKNSEISWSKTFWNRFASESFSISSKMAAKVQLSVLFLQL